SGQSEAHLWPTVSTKYKTASPLNGGLNGWDDDPAGIALSVMVSPTAGLNHSTASFRELGIVERSMVNAPPAGAYARYSAATAGCRDSSAPERAPFFRRSSATFLRSCFNAMSSGVWCIS